MDGEVVLLDFFKNSIAAETCWDIGATRATLVTKWNYKILHGAFTSLDDFF